MPSPQDICYNALVDIQVIGQDQSGIDSGDIALCISKFNRRVSQFNAKKSFASYEYTQVFTLPTAANSYTIGAAADFPDLIVTGGRAPVSIDSAKRILTGSAQPTETEIPVWTFQQWNQLAIPSLSTNLTLGVYLQTIPRLPKLWCYGFATGEQLRLSWRVLLNTVDITTFATNMDFQDGFEDMLTLTLSEDFCIPFKKPIPQDLKDRAREARMNIMALNGVPNIAFPDVPRSEGAGYLDRGNFNSRTV